MPSRSASSSFSTPSINSAHSRASLSLQDKHLLIQEKTRDLKDGIDVMFGDSKDKVMETAERIEKSYLAPVTNHLKSFAASQPILFTFAAVFVVLSIIPVFTFLGFLFLATLVILGVAVVLSVSCILAVIFLASLALVPTLIFTFTIALVITTSLLFLYLTHRLYIHLRSSSDPSSALHAWIDETRSQFGLAAKVPVQQEAVNAMSLVKLEPNDDKVSYTRLLNSSSSSSTGTIVSGMVMADVKPKIEEISIDAKEWGVERIQLNMETL